MHEASPALPSLPALRQHVQEERARVKALRGECARLAADSSPDKEPQSDENSPATSTDHSEWKVRYEAQVDVNKQLQVQLESLRVTIQQEKGAAIEGKAGGIPDMTTADLKRLINKLNRDKNNIQSQLRDYEWRLDQEAKLFSTVDDKRKRMLMDIKKKPPSAHAAQKPGKVKGNQPIANGYAALAAKRHKIQARLTKKGPKP